jgi:hypothetical protein
MDVSIIKWVSNSWMYRLNETLIRGRIYYMGR